MAGVSWYELVVCIWLSAKRRAYFCKNIAIEMGRCIAILFKSIGVRGLFDSPDFLLPTVPPHFLLTVGSFQLEAELFFAYSCVWVLFSFFYLQLELFYLQLSFFAYNRKVCLRLWSGHAPTSTEAQKELKWPKSDSKVTPADPPQSGLKLTQKWLRTPFLSQFRVTFELRSRRPATGASGPKCPRSVPESVPENGGCPRECLRGHSRDTFWTLQSPGPEGPRGHPVGHSLEHPPFSGTLSGTLRDTLAARRARETPVAGQRHRNFWVTWGHSAVGPWKSLLSHFRVTLILSGFL